MIVLLVAMAALGDAKAPDRAKGFDEVTACRRITEADRRLACYDREVAALEGDVRDRKVVVLDQEQVRRTRRSLFGFSLPSLKLFGNDDGKDTKTAPAELTRIDTVVTGSTRLADGRIAFTVEDGARWVQDDDRTLMLARIKQGTKVRISRASLGSYFATFEGAAAAKVRRDR